jgi:hypothetical protein
MAVERPERLTMGESTGPSGAVEAGAYDPWHTVSTVRGQLEVRLIVFTIREEL